LSEHSGVMSANTENNGSVVCLSLTYYLQPNSGAIIKVLMENDYNEVIVVGTATAPLGNTQVMDDNLFHQYILLCLNCIIFVVSV